MKRITEQDYKDAADSIGCTIAAVKAVAEVESRGDGFLPDGRPKILFEAHQFSKFTAHKYDSLHPNISSRVWNKKPYKGGEAEHTRLGLAAELNREAALKAASWGKFQIMGFNWKLCGYSSLQAFINDMYAGEAGQLRAFIGYVKNRKDKKGISAAYYLKTLQFDKFAELFNGEGYRENKYDEKMTAAHEKYLH